MRALAAVAVAFLLAASPARAITLTFDGIVDPPAQVHFHSEEPGSPGPNVDVGNGYNLYFAYGYVWDAASAGAPGSGVVASGSDFVADLANTAHQPLVLSNTTPFEMVSFLGTDTYVGPTGQNQNIVVTGTYAAGGTITQTFTTDTTDGFQLFSFGAGWTGLSSVTFFSTFDMSYDDMVVLGPGDDNGEVNPVPEPGSLALLAAGAVALGVRGRPRVKRGER